jgi:hypothetical protein
VTQTSKPVEVQEGQAAAPMEPLVVSTADEVKASIELKSVLRLRDASAVPRRTRPGFDASRHSRPRLRRGARGRRAHGRADSLEGDLQRGTAHGVAARRGRARRSRGGGSRRAGGVDRVVAHTDESAYHTRSSTRAGSSGSPRR